MRWGSEHACMVRAVAAAGMAVITVASAAPAYAQKRIDDSAARANTDTSYGRIEGDLALVLGAGATVAPRGPRATLDFRARYLDTAGLFFSYEDAPLVSSGAEPRRIMATGLELRPLFIARWATGRHSAQGRLDLLIDSFGLELGLLFAQPSGSAFASRPGLQAGLGVELPVFARATGIWIGIHGGLRWSDLALGGADTASANDRAAYLSLTLAWHQLIYTGAVDVGDARVR
jgi:hypothetical protein